MPRQWRRDVGEFLFVATTGRTAPRVNDTGVRSIRSLAARLGGNRAAAAQLGVSVRTVQRWTTPNAERRQKPSAASAGRIRTAATEQRRADVARAATSRRANRMRTTGATLRVQGAGGPVNDSPGGSIKSRDLTQFLSGDQVDDLYTAAAESDQAALAVINRIYAEDYMGDGQDWSWDDISALNLRD